MWVQCVAMLLAAGASAPSSEKVAWGPARGGLQAGLVLQGSKRSYRPGESITFQLQVRNTGGAAHSLTYFMGILDDLAPIVVDAQGKKRDVLMPPFELNKRQNVDETLKPGQTIDLGTVKVVFRGSVEDDSVNLPTVRAAPGKYRLSYVGFAASDRELVTGRVELEIASDP